MAKLTGKAKQRARAKARNKNKEPKVFVNFVDKMLSTTENVFDLMSLDDSELNNNLVNLMTTQFREDGFLKTVTQKGQLCKSYHLPKAGAKKPYLSSIQPDMEEKPLLVMEDWEYANFISHHTHVTVRDNKTAKQDIKRFPEKLREAIKTNPTMFVSEVKSTNGDKIANIWMGFKMREAA